MSIHLLNGKVCLIAKLTHDLFVIISFLILAAITIISLLFWYFLKSITGKMETCITRITVKHLIRIIIKAAEAYLTICLEKFLIIRIIALGWSNKLFILDEVVQHLHGFVRMTMLKIFEDSYPHQILFYFGDL